MSGVIRCANALNKGPLVNFEPPPLEPAIAEAADALFARREAAGGADPER